MVREVKVAVLGLLGELVEGDAGGRLFLVSLNHRPLRLFNIVINLLVVCLVHIVIRIHIVDEGSNSFVVLGLLRAAGILAFRGVMPVHLWIG